MICITSTTIDGEVQIFFMPVRGFQGEVISHSKFPSSDLYCTFKKSFPHRTGLATGVVTALFGLSPLFLSSIGNSFFANGVDGIDAPRYLLFLAVFAGSANLLGAIGLRSVPRNDHPAINAIGPGETPVVPGGSDESSPLLSVDRSAIHPDRLLSLLKDVDFWLLGLIMLVVMGMVSLKSVSFDTLSLPYCYPVRDGHIKYWDHRCILCTVTARRRRITCHSWLTSPSNQLCKHALSLDDRPCC